VPARHLASTLALLVALSGCAARTTPAGAAPGPAAAEPAPQAANATEVSEAFVRAHLEFLASDALNGRGSGTRDEWLAATYIASQFREWGLEPMGDDGGYVQRVDLAGAQATAPPTLTIGDRTFTHGREMLVLTLGAAPARGRLLKLAAGGAAPPGAVALVPEGAKVGIADAAIVLEPETPQVRRVWAARAARMPSRPLRPSGLAPPVPGRTVIFLETAAYAAVSALADGTEVSFAADLEPAAGATWNAGGRLTGSNPAAAGDVLVLSAHLDHLGARPPSPGADTIFNGADDDASGTVAVMALAHALAQGPRPRRTVVFALFGSEEAGGHGAAYFVDRPVVPLDRIVADVQFEMLGRPDPMLPEDTLWLTGYERSTLGADLAAAGANLVADPRPDQSFFTRSDNIRFARRGVVAHTISSFGLHEAYHTPDDEVALIDFDHMTRAIASLVAPIRALANSTVRPAWLPGGCPAPCK
jgi:hypothetical protein